MKTEEIKSIKIEFEADEADHFKSAIKKITKEVTKIGFDKTLNSDEVKIIKDLDSKINA